MTSLTIEYEDYDGMRRRLRLEPRQKGPGYWLLEEIQDEEAWRSVGREPIGNVVVDHESDAIV